MYMIIYDTLEKMFRKSLEKKKRVGIICVLKKVWKVQMCDISENMKTCENREMISLYALYRKLKWVGVIPLKSFRKKPIC